MKQSPNADQLAALKAFAAKHGRTWKSRLNAAWCNGADAEEADGCFLRQVRNEFGPTWLIKFRLEK